MTSLAMEIGRGAATAPRPTPVEKLRLQVAQHATDDAGDRLVDLRRKRERGRQRILRSTFATCALRARGTRRALRALRLLGSEQSQWIEKFLNHRKSPPAESSARATRRVTA